jgi:hypothetical protein
VTDAPPCPYRQPNVEVTCSPEWSIRVGPVIGACPFRSLHFLSPRLPVRCTRRCVLAPVVHSASPAVAENCYYQYWYPPAEPLCSETRHPRPIAIDLGPAQKNFRSSICGRPLFSPAATVRLGALHFNSGNGPTLRSVRPLRRGPSVTLSVTTIPDHHAQLPGRTADAAPRHLSAAPSPNPITPTLHSAYRPRFQHRKRHFSVCSPAYSGVDRPVAVQSRRITTPEIRH